MPASPEVLVGERLVHVVQQLKGLQFAALRQQHALDKWRGGRAVEEQVHRHCDDADIGDQEAPQQPRPGG